MGCPIFFIISNQDADEIKHDSNNNYEVSVRKKKKDNYGVDLHGREYNYLWGLCGVLN